MTDPDIKLALVVISGFSQRLGERSGMSRLYWSLRERFSTSPRHFVIEQEWRDDMKQLARKLARNCARATNGLPVMTTAVVGYSWGCGLGVTRLCAQLARYDLPVNLLCLVDPVPKRPGWFLSPRQLYALSRIGVYDVPEKVRAVRSWRTVNKAGPFSPVGRVARRTNPATIEYPETIFGRNNRQLDRYGKRRQYEPNGVWSLQVLDPSVTHNTIDDHPRVHREIIDAVRELVKP